MLNRGRKLAGLICLTGVCAYSSVENPRTSDLDTVSWKLHALRMIPWRAGSRLWGVVHEQPIPLFVRSPLYSLWGIVFGSDLTEAELSLSAYPHLSAFFTRRLRDGVRPFSEQPVVSPVDGRVLEFGTVGSTSLCKVKGVQYNVGDLLGSCPVVGKGNKLYHCTIYLAPGDYHRIHASTSWDIKKCSHFVGELFPVAPVLVKAIPGIFTLNERIVFSGSWEHGFYSLTAVGAANVGSIELSDVLTPPVTLHTNTRKQYSEFLCKVGSRLPYSETDLNPAIKLLPEDELALFNLGSTVVLVFEAPESFEFNVVNGQQIHLGQGIGIHRI